MNYLFLKGKKIFFKYSLLFFVSVIKYTCKSVVDTEIHNTAHHFPPYHIGNRLTTARLQADYHFYAILMAYAIQRIVA